MKDGKEQTIIMIQMKIIIRSINKKKMKREIERIRKESLKWKILKQIIILDTKKKILHISQLLQDKLPRIQ
jgi:hypothetical protein